MSDHLVSEKQAEVWQFYIQYLSANCFQPTTSGCVVNPVKKGFFDYTTYETRTNKKRRPTAERALRLKGVIRARAGGGPRWRPGCLRPTEE
jgi:hypothetical protein